MTLFLLMYCKLSYYEVTRTRCPAQIFYDLLSKNISREECELTRKFWHLLRTVLAVHSRGATGPKSGNRCMLWVILLTGMMLASWYPLRSACETLYMRWCCSGWSRNGVNHSTYARCCGTLIVGRKSCLMAFGFNENTTRIRATR
jgi:hypothetical protein